MADTNDLKKYISFDLNTIALKKFFKSENYSKAYVQLGALLHKNGFEHQQGSCYVSKEKLPNIAIYNLIIKIKKELPWAKTCIKHITHTDVGDMFYDDMRLIRPKQKQKQLQKIKQNTKARKPSQMPKRDKKLNNDHTLTR